MARTSMLTRGVAWCALLTVIATWFVAAVTAAPASATTVSPAQKVPGTTNFLGVACPTATCFAVGYLQTGTPEAGSAILVPITNGTAGALQTLPLPGTAFSAVACGTASTCYALGTQQSIVTFPVPHPVSQTIVVPITDGVFGAPQPVPGAALSALACASATTCYAAGTRPSGAVLVPLVNGVAGAPQAVPGVDLINAMACTTPTACFVTGSSSGSSGIQGVLVPITDGVVGTPQVADGFSSFAGVACTSATTCYVLTHAGPNGNFQAYVIPIVDGVLGAPVVIGNATGLSSLACMSATTCEAVGASDAGGVVVPIVNGVPGAIGVVPGTSVLNGVACAGPTTCVAAGYTFDTGYSGVFVTVDEPLTGPSACRNGGWRTFRSPAFKNQADCVSHLQLLARCQRLSSRPVPPGDVGSQQLQRWFLRFSGCPRSAAG